MESITLRDRAASEAAILIRAAGSGRQRDRSLSPMHQVPAHGVTPVHRAPEGAVGVVLIEDVILPIPDERDRIVHPIVGGEMVGRAVGIDGHELPPVPMKIRSLSVLHLQG